MDDFDWAGLECERYGRLLREWCWPFKDDPSYLWDPNQSLELLWPNVVKPEERQSLEADFTFRFIGRSIAQKLYKRLTAPECRVSVMGAKGSGKSFLVAAVCNHLHQSGRQRVMFLDAQSLFEDPLLTLWKSLLLAFHGDEDKTKEIQEIRHLEKLRVWSYHQKLVIVVDDWESLAFNEEDTEELKNAKRAAENLILRLERDSRHHLLVQVSSVHSRERSKLEKSCLKKRMRLEREKFVVDGPFDDREFATWMGLSSLPQELKVSGVVKYLTGGMPLLLELLQMSQGDESELSQSLTKMLWSEFLVKLTTHDELHAALKLIIEGDRGAALTGKVKLTCFYTDTHGRWRILCPYLEREARKWIQRRQQELEVLDAGMLNDSLKMWMDVVTRDIRNGLQLSALHSARIGWNVEGLVIDHIWYQKAVFQGEEWSTFKHVVEYAHGMEAQACSTTKISDQQLLDGVLLVPIAFNDKAADLLLIKVVGDVLRLDAFQITISKWKLRSKRKSHIVWRNEVAPAWNRALENGQLDLWGDNEQTHRVAKAEDRYYYLTPESVKPEDLPPDEEGPAEDRPVEFKRLGQINPKLSHLDIMLNVAQAAAVL